MKKSLFSQKLQDYCALLESEFSLISEDRRPLLESLSRYILDKINQHLPVKIIVICTHNSRRSHMGQLWLKIAAMWYQLPNIETYSGGTEATAFNHRSVIALRNAGVELEQITQSDNPKYVFDLDPEKELFSKKYDADINPNKDFAAVMVCTDADEGCPFIPGAEARFSIPYEDPKKFDDTAFEAEKYAERAQQIGRELFYVMNFTKLLLSNQ